jgi:hypothetical protein
LRGKSQRAQACYICAIIIAKTRHHMAAMQAKLSVLPITHSPATAQARLGRYALE